MNILLQNMGSIYRAVENVPSHAHLNPLRSVVLRQNLPLGAVSKLNENIQVWKTSSVGALHVQTNNNKARAATRTAATASDTHSQEAPSETEAQVKFTFKVDNACELTISAQLGPDAAPGAGVLVSLYHHFLSRPKRLAGLTLRLLEENPALGNLKHPLGDDLLLELQQRPDSAVKLLDGLGHLLELCKIAAPQEAADVEREMAQEVALLKAKIASSGTDTPSAVQAANAADLEFAESFSAGNSMGIALKLVGGPRWERWKRQLRSALITREPPPKLPNGGTNATLRLTCLSRTADDFPLDAKLEIIATGASVAAVRQDGPQADAASRALFSLMFNQQRENGMLEAIGAAAWDSAQVNMDATTFRCVFPLKEALNKTINSDNGIRYEIVIEGNGHEMYTLVMSLAVLEAEELPGSRRSTRWWSHWLPANGRIQIRQRGPSRSNRQTQYELRVQNGEKIEEYELNMRQVRGLIDCLDAFGQVNPRFGVGEPRQEIAPVPVWRLLGLVAV